MTKQEMASLIRKIKKDAGLDFARSSGKCCGTCTWAEIGSEMEKKGITEPHGIWLKEFSSGMNKRRGDFEDFKHFHISHDLTDEQAEKVMEVLRNYPGIKNPVYEGHDVTIQFEIGDKEEVEEVEDDIEEDSYESDLSDIADGIVDEIKIGMRDSEGNLK